MERKNSMIRLNRRVLITAAAAAVATPSRARQAVGSDATLETALEAALATPGAPPAMAAGIVTPSGLEWSGVRGVRRVGDDEAATDQDRWHIGSNTKAMTAAAYARLVERGLTDWARPLSDIFAGVTIDPAFAATTPDDLARHVAGLTDQTALPLLMVMRADTRPVAEQRAANVATALGRPPGGTPGRFAYGNVNYVLLGAAIERITGRPWEDVIAAEVFTPLGLSGAGLGAPLHDAVGRQSADAGTGGDGAYDAERLRPLAAGHDRRRTDLAVGRERARTDHPARGPALCARLDHAARALGGRNDDHRPRRVQHPVARDRRGRAGQGAGRLRAVERRP